MTVATVLGLLGIAAVALGFGVRRSGGRDAAAVLRLLAVLFAVVGAAVAFPAAVSDSGAFAIWGLGLPVLVTLAPLVAARYRHGTAVTWVAAILLLGWSVLLALGVGLALLPAALAETAAAVAQRRPRHSRDLTALASGG